MVLITMLLGASVMMTLFSHRGYVRLLGVAHFVWIPMLPWLAVRYQHADAGSLFGLWILSVLVLDGLSLIIDIVDVIRYTRGDRAPTVTQ